MTLFYFVKIKLTAKNIEYWLKLNIFKKIFIFSSISQNGEIHDFINTKSNVQLIKFNKKNIAKQISDLYYQNNIDSEIMFAEDNMIIDKKSIFKLKDTLYVTERHAIVLPRHDGSTFLSINRSGENETEYSFKKLSKLLPAYHRVFYNDTTCMIIKNNVFELYWHKLLDITDNWPLFYILQYFCATVCEYGYGMIACNTAFLHLNEWKNTYNKTIINNINNKYPSVNILHQKYLIQNIPAIEYFSDNICSKNKDKKILFYLLPIGPVYNGTSEYGLSLLYSINKKYKKKYDITVLLSKETDNFHNVSKNGIKVINELSTEHIFDLAIMPFQALRKDEQVLMNKHALRIVYSMLDIIMLRSNYLNAEDTDRETLLKLSFLLSDGIICISDYTKKDFLNYYLNDPYLSKIKIRTIWPCINYFNDKYIYEELPFEEYILVFGNNFKHKLINDIIDNLKEIKKNFIVIGFAADLSTDTKLIYPNILTIGSGHLKNEYLNLLFFKCSMLIFPSCYEGFGLPIFTAIQMNKPVIVHENELNKEIIEGFNEIKNYFYFYKNFNEIPKLIDQALNKTYIKHKISWNWDKHTVEFENFVQDILKQDINIQKLNERWQVFNYLESLYVNINNIENQCNNLNLEKNNLITEKDRLVHERDALVHEKNNLIKKNNYLIEENNKLIDNINNLIIERDSLLNSRSWRITKPLRKLGDFIRRHKALRLFAKGLLSIKREGLYKTLKKIKNFSNENNDINYQHNRIVTKKLRKFQEKAKFSKNIKISIITPLYNTPEIYLKEMIESVKAQTYKNWELCLTNGSDTKHEKIENIVKNYIKNEKRIKYKKLNKNEGISGNTNEGIKMSTGEYIGLLDHDDVLHPSALYEVMKVICEQDADFIYSDEAVFRSDNKIITKHYKPDFAIDTLLSNNYICHFSVFSREITEKAGLFRDKYDGSQDHDLILRYTDIAKKIIHIPKILYYWRSHDNSAAADISNKQYAIIAGQNAVRDFLLSKGINAKVESTDVCATMYRIHYELLEMQLISIIIPNKDNIDILSECINSILNKSTYKNIEIIIIENNSEKESTFEYYESLRKNKNIKIISYNNENKEFNYSEVNNFGVKYAEGKHIIFLNNDITIITPNWIEEMLMYSQRNDVGAVGAKLYYPDDTIQHAGVILGLNGTAGHLFYRLPKYAGTYMGKTFHVQNLSAVTAACLMIKKSIFEEVGGFDKSLKLSYNDVDLCLKVRKKGYLIVWTPFAEAYHHESKTRGHYRTINERLKLEEEGNIFLSKWNEEIKKGDPYFNPNFRLDIQDCSHS